MSVSLQQLQVFYAVYKTGSFTQAAEELYLTQPAVSMHIRSLENHYGIKLFHRRGKQISLTEAGEVLLGHADQILNLVHSADEAMASLTGNLKGHLRIGCSPCLTVGSLANLIRQFHTQHPALKISVVSEATPLILTKLEKAELDLALVEGSVTRTSAQATQLGSFNMVVVAPENHPWGDRPSVTLAEVVEAPLILREPHSHTREMLEGIFKKHQISPRHIIAEFNHPNLIKEAVQLGMGVALLSSWAFTPLDTGIRIYQLADEEIIRHAQLVYCPRFSTTPSMQAFVDFLHSAWDDHASTKDADISRLSADSAESIAQI